MATRVGDANENGYDEDNAPPRRRQTKYTLTQQPHHGFVFKPFTRESQLNKRRAIDGKKRSLAPSEGVLGRPKNEPDPYLASGQQLPPAIVRHLPSELQGKPIEDIDPYYEDRETFVIISRGKELTRFSATKALCILGPFHPIRRVVLYILVNPIFNLLVILTILINCILMTIQGSETVEKTEIIFTIVYTTEMGLKVLARGFIMEEFTYLRDPWNWLDFAVIIMAYLTIVIEDLGNLSVMRTFRVLRALKTVAIIPGMKTIVGAVIDSVKNLKDVVVLTLFSLSVFSLLGLQIYMGQLTQKCILNGPGNMSDTEWFAWCSNSSHWVPEPDEEIFGAYRLCGNATGAQSCPEDHTCLQGFGPNPDYGFTNFDTFGWALICSFRLMTQDFWEGLYMQVLKTAGSWHIIFFIVSIFLGSIYLMNLILAIVAMSYNELQRRAEEEEEAAAEDEAAFLESCRLMELHEQLSQGSNGTGGGSRTRSYRPSVEIGLVGQSLLASLCQNGLLGQQVRDKLNQQMILPGFGQPNARSQSLCVNMEPRNNASSYHRGHPNRAALDGGGGGPRTTASSVVLQSCTSGNASTITAKDAHSKQMRSGSMLEAAGYCHPGAKVASSMTELRRKSSVRTNESSSPTHLAPDYQPASSRLGPSSPWRSTSPVHHQHHQLQPAPPALPAPHSQHQGAPVGRCTAGSQRGTVQGGGCKLSPHHKSSSVLMARMSTGSQDQAAGPRSTRSSVTSDRDISVLRQRAALIKIGDTLGKKRTAVAGEGGEDSQSSFELTGSHKSALSYQTVEDYTGSHEDETGSLGTTSATRLSPHANGSAATIRRRSAASYRGDVGQQAGNNQYLDTASGRAVKLRTKSQDYSTEQHLSVDENRYQLNRPSSPLRAPKKSHLQATHFGSEAAICKQPKSITANPFGANLPLQRRSLYQRRSVVTVSDSSDTSSDVKNNATRRSIDTAETQAQAQAHHHWPQTSLITPDASPVHAHRLTEPTETALGGSTQVLAVSSSASGRGGGSKQVARAKLGGSVTGSVQQLGVSRCLKGDNMNHLSVENFQQFGCTPARQSLSSTQAAEPTGSQSAGTAQVAYLSLQQFHDDAKTSDSSAHTSAHSDIQPQQLLQQSSQVNPIVTGYIRGRLESRANVHPSTMVRSPLIAARPRQSMVAPTSGGGPVGGASNARRISQDFARRASDWSRMSMTTNHDLRRLIRLWSHTNPYQDPRSRVNSISNYSQANASDYFYSPSHSVRDLASSENRLAANNSQYNSPRPSSVGSARQAYELISAISRRRSRFQSDARYPLPYFEEDDDLMFDKMSVNMRDKCLAYCLSCLDILCIWECCGAWLKIQRLISVVVFDPFTELFIILCILINTLFMALDSDDADAQMKSIFERGNYFFTATFAVEASMKIMALSPKFYFREGWNVFDAIIVGLSLLELGLEGVYGLSVLRSFRLLRVFKLAKSWPTLNLLISIMGKAVGDLGNLTFVLAIIVFIFAVMGMQLFGNKYVAHNFPSGELPRWNFTDFMHSFMIVFRILCAEWIEPMWDCLLVGGWPCIPFFLIAVTVGNLVVLNLFLALLLASFGASNLSSPQADNVDTKKLQEAIARFSRFGRWVRKRVSLLIGRMIACCLGKKKGQTSSDGRDGSGLGSNGSDRVVKSHIVAMSKLERLKNIELRTEELKSKIKRSPEHHHHLRQLAQSQLKESCSGRTSPLSANSEFGSTLAGYNYNYKYKSPQGIEVSQPLPNIPIIVNEASESADEKADEEHQPVSPASPLASERRTTVDFCGPIVPSITSSSPMSFYRVVLNEEEQGEINENQASIRELYLRSAIKMDSAGEGRSEEIQTLASNEQHQLSSDKQPSTGCVSKASVVRYPGYLIDMQPIKEDSHDTDSNASFSFSVSETSRNKPVDTKDETKPSSSPSSRNKWRRISTQLMNQAQQKANSWTTTAVEADNENSAQMERLIGPVECETGSDKSHQSAAKDLKKTKKEVTQKEEQASMVESMEEDQRPKSSLYLKAPRRQDMEEEDERALQHIETYIEKCICFGILCLKWFLFRQYVRKIVEHRYFDQCILVLIVISSGTLALEDKHLNERPTLKRTLDVLDTIFTIIFSLEMIFKWLAFGMKRYFGNIWSWLDFVIVMVSVVNLMASIFGSGKIQALKTMRTLRAMRGLRPLRALQRFQGMRVVVNALIQAIPSIFNVLLVCLIFWLIFSIMGVQMFGGKFWRCINPETDKLINYEEASNRFECIERNYTWSNPQINFDNVLNAYLALFQVATFKGWIDIMNSATDSRTRDDQPIREANIYMYFYFVFFVIFGSFFTLNLFIGVIIDNFNEQKKKTGGSLEIFMTDDQKKYYHAMKKMKSKRPVKAMTRPKLKLQAYMFDITTSKKFDMAIMLIIGLNMFVMALEHHGQSQEFSSVLENLNLIFIAIFTLECLSKIFAMRHFYFREPWNVFDFIVVALSILGVVMKEYVAKYFVSPTLLRVVRVVKVGRVLRLVKGAKGIRTLLFALAMSLPALFNICLLLFLVMFIYAIFGMSFFMNVRKRSGIDETFNFETFTSSIIVLFQMSTSAAWDMVLDPLMDEENDCQKPDLIQGIEGTCGNKGIAIAYLISYVIVTFLIIINMYIAVILENYSQATEDVQEGLTDDDYEMYYEIWQKFDPDGTQYLPYEKLSDFVDALEDPLRIPKPNGLALVVLDINIYEGNQCYCVDILDALTKFFFTRKGLVIQVNEHLQKVQSILHETPFERITTTYMVKRQHYCATLIQNCWRKWKENARRHIDERSQREATSEIRD